MISRKEFLKQSVYVAAGTTWAGKIAGCFLNASEGLPITILYTNDTHARLDPFPQNAREYAGLGGIAIRSSLVDKIRIEEKHVLLLDAGDVFQGTPWFDVYGGKVDFELMSKMRYDAMAIGNHEFDRGLDGFAEAAKRADFPFLAANYLARNTPMHPYLERHVIKEMDGFRIGIFGLGIGLENIVEPALYDGVRYRDPVTVSKRVVDSLREIHRCNYVICLSHLGYRYENNQIDDLTLARSVGGIDLIIGGHTHTFLDAPVSIKNPNGSTTLVTQVGHSGIRLGRIDLKISDQTEQPVTTSQYYTIGKQE